MPRRHNLHTILYFSCDSWNPPMFVLKAMARSWYLRAIYEQDEIRVR